MRDPALQKAIDVLGDKSKPGRPGGIEKLAELLGISQAAVSQWERCPATRVLEVERHTRISRSELRPDLYPPSRKRKAQKGRAA